MSPIASKGDTWGADFARGVITMGFFLQSLQSDERGNLCSNWEMLACAQGKEVMEGEEGL